MRGGENSIFKWRKGKIEIIFPYQALFPIFDLRMTVVARSIENMMAYIFKLEVLVMRFDSRKLRRKLASSFLSKEKKSIILR